jgi:hypothetical protein
MALFRIPVKATTRDLHLGIPVYWPTPGEILRDAWLEVVTAWNASPAFADVGTLIGSADGLYALASADGPVDMTAPDRPASGTVGDVLVGATGDDLAVAGSIGKPSPSVAQRPAPARFMSAAPLQIVVSQDGKAGPGGGTYGSVVAAAPPTLAASYAGLVGSDPSSCYAAIAQVVATAPPTLPTAVVAGVNDTFKYGPPGGEIIYTVAPGSYTTIFELSTALNAATGGGGTFGDVGGIFPLDPADTSLFGTAPARGPRWDGWDFLTGPTDILAATGFSSGQALSGGDAETPVVVAGGANDTFQFGAPGSEDTYTVAPGSYATSADLAAAMAAATKPGGAALSAIVGIATGSGGLLGYFVATAAAVGNTWNGWDFLSGATDFLNESGFLSGAALAGGGPPALVVLTGANDAFQFGAPGSEAVYTVAAGTYTGVADVATAMAAATKPGGARLSAVVSVAAGTGGSAGKLVATAVTQGNTWNGWDFLTGVADFLAASGFSNAQALGGGGGGPGGPTGAAAGEANLYLDVEAAYPPPPWSAPTEPSAPAFDYAGKV